MNIQQLKYVLAVVEYRHFESAAEKCCVTQSTLSTMISKLEDEINIKIFDRSKKPVQVTSEGAVVIEQLRIIIHDINQLGELVKEIKGEVNGNLTMAVIPTIAPFLLPVFLQDFAEKFPELQIEVKEQTTQEIIRLIKLRELDIGIVSVPLQDEDIIELKLYDEPFVLYDAALKNKDNTPVKKMDLSNLLLMEDGHCMRTQALQVCDRSKVVKKSTVNFTFKAGSIDSLVRFVKVNKASTLLPYLSILDFNELEKCHIKYFSSPVPMRSVGLVIHKHFVKKKILELVQKEIIEKITPLLPQKIRGEILFPMI